MRAMLTAATSSGPRLRPLLLALLGASLAFACRPAGSPSQANKTLTIGTSIPQGVDRRGTNFIVNLLVLEAPVAIDWNGRPQPRVVTWEWLEGDLGLRLRLKPGITFHDGTALTNGLAAEILRAQLKENALSSTIYSVEAEGTDAVVIRTKAKEGFLLNDLATTGFSLPKRAPCRHRAVSLRIRGSARRSPGLRDLQTGAAGTRHGQDCRVSPPSGPPGRR